MQEMAEDHGVSTSGSSRHRRWSDSGPAACGRKHWLLLHPAREPTSPASRLHVSCGQGPAAERDSKQGVFPEQRPIHKTQPFFRKFSLSASAIRRASFLPDLQAAVEGAT